MSVRQSVDGCITSAILSILGGEKGERDDERKGGDEGIRACNVGKRVEKNNQL